MRKIPTLFVRDRESNRVTEAVAPGCEWVVEGIGVATRKFDGTCCLVRDGKLFKRHEVKPGGTPPGGFEPADEVDPVTGKRQGWVPVGDGPEDRWHREAFDDLAESCAPDVRPEDLDGTYELCGPKIQGNPEGFAGHYLVQHGTEWLEDCPSDFAALMAYLAGRDIEGIVWWREPGNPDAGLVKIKGRDFGIKRRSKIEAAS